MNYNALRILILSMCLYAGCAYGMDAELEKRTSNLESAQQLKKQALEVHIKERKLCNLKHAALTLFTIGIDIANSYWDEEGLLEQHIDKKCKPSQLCECPNRTAYCTIQEKNWDSSICKQTEDSVWLYGVNDGMAIWRVYTGVWSLHHLYKVQRALTAQSVIEDTQTPNEKDESYLWCITQSISAGIIGAITGAASIAHGINDYPRTMAVWGMNAAVDAISAYNWHKNKKACEAVIEQNRLKNVIIHDEK